MKINNQQLIHLIKETRNKAIHSRSRAIRSLNKIKLLRLRRIYRHRRHGFDSAQVTFEWLWLLTEARKHGWKGTLGGPATGLRTYEQQKRLFSLFMTGRGAPAFSPDGPSRHMIRNVKRRGGWSQAVDATDPVGLIAAASKLGVRLHRPYLPREPWHVEAATKFKAPKTFIP